MTRVALSRAGGQGRPAAPVRLMHLGLGNFFRAHQAWYTDRAPDAPEWGIAAFTGRSAQLSGSLAAQDGLYMLITRAAAGDRFTAVCSLSRAHSADEHPAWLGYLRSADVRAVTITVTEAGYVRGPDGGLDRDHPAVQADVQALRRDEAALVKTAPARLVAGLAARRRADAGPLSLIPCDNLPGNGQVAARVVCDLAEMVDPALRSWLERSVSTVTTVVDRITPRTTEEDRRSLARATGVEDCCPVATEPFSEWVLSGRFPGGRPRWEEPGATFTDDVTPFEHRKLWLLNGGHSLLAYTGTALGHTSVAEAVGDDACRGWLEQWWSEASPYLDQAADDVAAYRTALLDRFANPRLQHALSQIAADGSQKLPVRILPVLRRERSAGRVPRGATLVVAAWVCHLRGKGAAVSDVRADEVVPLATGRLVDAVPRVLGALDPALAEDREVVTAVVESSEQMERMEAR